jgi:hypothetical protein
MNAYCPECETDLDVTTGICPACRWDPTAAALEAQAAEEPEQSLTERYRGTQYDISLQQAAFNDATTVSRGRAFVLMALVGCVALYGVAMGAMGIL